MIHLFISGELEDPKHFNYPNEVGAAYKNDSLCLDVRQEIQKLKLADLVIFQFPMQWASVPAILKGWFERVLIKDFAFSFPKMLDEGLIKVIVKYISGYFYFSMIIIDRYRKTYAYFTMKAR